MPRLLGAQGRPIGAYATGATAVGTTITAVAGLSLTIPTAGTWRLEGWIPTVIVGLPTAYTLTISPTGAPPISSMRALVRRSDATTAWVDSYLTAFNTASTSSSLTAQTYLFDIDGAVVTTGAGMYSVSMTRTGGTSATTQISSFILAIRID